MGSNAAGAAGPAKAAGTIVAGAVMGTSWKRCVGSWYGYRASSRCWSRYLTMKTMQGGNHRTDSRVVVQESEYMCAQMKSQFTAVCNEEIVDFESVTVFDLYINPEGLDVLLQRTVVAPRNSNAPLPRFNQARPR